jgi:V/A-type H+-transporting ATPase subunit I
MFGDVGQGLIFFLAGLFLLKKKSALGGIFTGGGLMAMVFGFMYGSIFSNEHLIKPLFMNPMENANITTMLVIGIGFGVVMMIVGMILNIINGIKAKDMGRVFLDRNGVAGLVFYGVIISIVVSLLFFGKVWASTVVLAICILVPFLIIFFKHPIENILKKKPAMPDGASGFFVETIFEMIDMLLGFASNTISFVRLSAFAINHVGLSMAFNILAQMSSNPAVQTIIMIVGNAAIIVLEGMVVGIQGLRLTYYELFSRFYKGDGVPYEPIIKKKSK